MRMASTLQGRTQKRSNDIPRVNTFGKEHQEIFEVLNRNVLTLFQVLWFPLPCKTGSDIILTIKEVSEKQIRTAES